MKSRKCVEGFGTLPGHLASLLHWLLFLSMGSSEQTLSGWKCTETFSFIPISSNFSSPAWIKVDSFSLKTCQQVVPQNGSYLVRRSQGGVLSIRTVLNKSPWCLETSKFCLQGRSRIFRTTLSGGRKCAQGFSTFVVYVLQELHKRLWSFVFCCWKCAEDFGAQPNSSSLLPLCCKVKWEEI